VNGWEQRGDKWYLYDSRRVGTRVVKTYLAARRDRLVPGFGQLMADQLAEKREARAEARESARRARAERLGRIEDLVRPAAEADRLLEAGAGLLLAAAGYHRPARKPWRRSRKGADMKALKSRLDKLTAALKNFKPGPAINYVAPADDPEAAEVFAKARAGDPVALARLPDLIAGRGWANWLGDLGQQATRQLIYRASGGDAVWEAGLTAKVRDLRRELLGPDPTPLDEVLVRRVIVNWVAVHTLEVEQAVRPPADPRAAEHLDRALSRAQRRLTEAAKALAAVRRLGVTVVMNVAGRQQVNIK
jgi:hypothetical protein